MAFRATAAVSLLAELYFIGAAAAAAADYSNQALSLHIDTLLAEYDREVPPAAQLQLTLSLDVRHASVDDFTATMRLLADLEMSWSEPRLTWNASTWEGESVMVSAERLWTPDVALASAGSASAPGADLRARIASDGAVSLVRRLDLTAPLALQLREWPHDTQEGVFKFASRAHSEDEIELSIADFESSVVEESGAWQMLSAEGVATSWWRADGSRVSGAEWRVRAARRGAAAAAAAGAVLAAALQLLLAAAVLPYSQRTPLVAAATVVSATWLTCAIFHMPGSSSVPLAVRVLGGVCAAGAASGAAAAAAAWLARRSSTPPHTLRRALSRLSAIYPLTPDLEQNGSGVGSAGGVGGAGSGAWAAAARLLDAAAVAALLLTLLVLAAVYFLS